MLEEVTRQVQPIMRKHSWRVPLVTEFFPNNPRLLVCSVARASLLWVNWGQVNCAVQSGS